MMRSWWMMAERVRSSSTNSSRERPSLNSTTFRAARAISRRLASSLDIDGLRSGKNRIPPEPILAPFDRPPGDDVDGAAQDRAQLIFHGDVIEQAPCGCRLEGHEHVDV